MVFLVQPITGRVLKQLVNVFQTRTLNLLLHSSIKPICTVNEGTFVVTLEKKEILLVLDLVHEKKAYSLYALLATVHIISKKQIVCLVREPTMLKQS